MLFLLNSIVAAGDRDAGAHALTRAAKRPTSVSLTRFTTGPLNRQQLPKALVCFARTVVRVVPSVTAA